MRKLVAAGVVALWVTAPTHAESVATASFGLVQECARLIAKATVEYEGSFTEDSYLIRYYRTCGHWEDEFLREMERDGKSRDDRDRRRAIGAHYLQKMHETAVETMTGKPMQRNMEKINTKKEAPSRSQGP